MNELGRMVLPIELRHTLGTAEKDDLKIFTDGEQVILRKYQPACSFCNLTDNVIKFKGKVICGSIKMR
ncbi:AbrB/MazE/SpoVT family DNA-binding domain-containing protein [Aneurinibacillus migulanus]|nr:AbrB/MazE/SpoVT family DNA-binding domain-containing protein [Aneurinibacillus migulanus]KIV53163.1 AbrB family transcriptional regulator [Aneurinibacillus migulanus]MED0895105.1 AbrB/MazE/SpoVT family DNA-binding domain-containing protein [Aneurinibacillus migulanus]MED1615942.1 AbrB/MazE/SpoVT family DNA-binding domain-containing protein [Aneurinibacillus migulanus]